MILYGITVPRFLRRIFARLGPTKRLHVVRVMAFLSAMTIGLLLVLSILTAADIIAPETIENLQDSNVLVRALGVFLGLTGPASAFGLWFFTLYHCATHQFKTPAAKKVWFVALFVGSLVVALVYYVVVFELKLSLRTDDTVPAEASPRVFSGTEQTRT